MAHLRALIFVAAALVLGPVAGARAAQVSLVPLTLDSQGSWARAGALESLAAELNLRTSTQTEARENPLDPASSLIFKHPFLVLWLDGPPPALTAEQTRNLAAYLGRGGTLLVDYSGEARGAKELLTAVAELLQTLLPGAELAPIPAGNVLFRSFYRVSNPVGRIRLFPELYGAQHEGRLAVIVSLNDLLGALARGRDGSHRFTVVPGGETQREAAIRLAVNILAYALCLDYKNDKIHLDYLRARRNFRLEDSRTGEGGTRP
jgi:hypothetical protein